MRVVVGRGLREADGKWGGRPRALSSLRVGSMTSVRCSSGHGEERRSGAGGVA